MKEYRYKINGNLYKVTVGDIEDNNVHVEVNGTAYTVELEKKAGPKNQTGSSYGSYYAGSSSSSSEPSGCGRQQVGYQVSASGCYSGNQGERRRYRETRTDIARARSHEDGKRHQGRP